MAAALLAVEEIGIVRNLLHQASLEEASEADTYPLYTRLSGCYDKLIEFLSGDCLLLLEKADNLVIDMIVEFKVLGFLAVIAAGTFVDGVHELWIPNQAEEQLEEMVKMTTYETLDFNEETIEKLGRKLDERRELVLAVLM